MEKTFCFSKLPTLFHQVEIPLDHLPEFIGQHKKNLKLPELFRASGFFQSAQNENFLQPFVRCQNFSGRIK
jgi:hypothetical protein